MADLDLKAQATTLIACVDFIKWTSSFGDGLFSQEDFPLPAIALAPSLSNLFGLAKDEAGTMLVMPGAEATWLENLPIESAYIGFNDSLILACAQTVLLDTKLPKFALSIFIPKKSQRQELSELVLLGFGISDQDGQVRRVNKIVPLLSPGRYAKLQMEKPRTTTRLGA